jgi:hypothetical protein
MSPAAVHALRRPGPAVPSRVQRVRRVDEHGRCTEQAPSLFDGLGGEPTLDDVLAGAWEGLAARSVVACPVCGDDMLPIDGAHALPVGGRCQGCSSTFS